MRDADRYPSNPRTSFIRASGLRVACGFGNGQSLAGIYWEVKFGFDACEPQPAPGNRLLWWGRAAFQLISNAFSMWGLTNKEEQCPPIETQRGTMPAIEKYSEANWEQGGTLPINLKTKGKACPIIDEQLEAEG